MTARVQRWRATTGIDYVSKKTGKPIRVEIDDEVKEMNDVAIRHEKAAGNIVPWDDAKSDTNEKGGESS